MAKTLVDLWPGPVDFPVTTPASYKNFNERVVLMFSSTTVDEVVIFPFIMPQEYEGGSVIVRVQYGASTTAGNTFVMAGEFEAHSDGGLAAGDIFDTIQEISSVAAPSVIAEIDIVTKTYTNAEAADIAVGDICRFRFRRDGSNVNDDHAGLLYVFGVSLEE